MNPEGASPARTACTVIVHGHVQGVAFRHHTRERARSLSLAGRVRNRSDGTVEVFVEGAPARVEALLDWLRHGPALARVERLVRTPASPEGRAIFEITE